MNRARRWVLALVITLMLVDAWTSGATAATGPRPSGAPAGCGASVGR